MTLRHTDLGASREALVAQRGPETETAREGKALGVSHIRCALALELEAQLPTRRVTREGPPELITTIGDGQGSAPCKLPAFRC